MTGPSAEELAARAKDAERLGRGAEAAQLWQELVARHPNHAKALFLQGRRRVEQGDPAGGLPLLAEAARADPADPEIPLFQALGHKTRGEFDAAFAAIDRALALDPYYFLALLSKGSMLERVARPRLAAKTYRDAVKIAPTPERLPQALRTQLDHAKDVIDTNAQGLQAHLRARTDAVRQRFAGENLDRFDEALDILAGRKKRQMQDPILLYYPRLPPIPFYDRAHFPWMKSLEAQTDVIRAELETVMREDMEKFAPYIQYPKHAPVNQWVKLNHSSAWSTFFLWKDGVRNDANCARAPKTAAIVEALPLAHQPGYGPTVMFSLLHPHTHIPPHTGSANTRLIAHLPLILPEQCRFRVGNDTRDWKMGEAWVFDDTIEHEAWNDSDETRVVMIFDVWNPLLSHGEIELVAEMMTALNDYERGAG